MATSPRGAQPAYAHAGAIARYDHRSDGDYYSQPGALYRLMSAAQRALLIDNLVGAMRSIPRDVRARQIAHFTAADPEYGARVGAGLERTAGA